MFQTEIIKKIKTHFVFSNFFPENCAIYEIMWKDTARPVRPQTTMQYGACDWNAE